MVGYQLTGIHKMHHFHGSVNLKLENNKFIFPLVIKEYVIIPFIECTLKYKTDMRRIDCLYQLFL